MEAPLHIVGCLLSSQPADALIDGFATAARRERAVVTARNAHSATFVRFDAPDARLLALACAAVSAADGAQLRFGFATATRAADAAAQDAWSLSERSVARARDLAAAAGAAEVLVTPQLARLLIESGHTFRTREVETTGGRTVAACAIDAAATPADPAGSEAATRQHVESEIEHRLAQQLARHAQAHSLQAASDAILSQVADMQRRLETDLGSLRTKLDDLFDWSRQTDGQIRQIESRRKVLDEVQARANGIVHTLRDLDVKLELLGEQRAMVDHVGDRLARLDFTLQEAQNTLRALQREREVAERIEQGLKALRSSRNTATKPATSQY
jgi:hypothetical protein